MRLAIGLTLLFAPPQVALAADPKPEIRVSAPPGSVAVIEVTRVGGPTLEAIRAAMLTPSEWAAVLRVVVAEGAAEGIAARPSAAGTYAVTKDAIRFEPQFPLDPGVRYQVSFDPSKARRLKLSGPSLTATVTVPKPPPGPPTAVAAVYPSANRLPENTLRLYVHFSGQMTRGDIYRHVKLVRDDGKEVESPFLEIDEELWSSDGTRITLLFHPGRVKQGLVPREELGPILESGRRYTLVIDRNWKDADGRPLVSEFRKTFTAGPADDEPVTPETWTLMAPRARSDAPVIVRLAKPLDHALLGRMVWVVDASGKRVEGETTVGGGERVLTFAPTRPWKVGEYKLVVNPQLEDVCGNRVGEPFEVDALKPVERKIETKTVERAFKVK